MFEIDGAEQAIALTLVPSFFAPETPHADRQAQAVIERLDQRHLDLIGRFFLDTDVASRLSRFGGTLSSAALLTYARSAIPRARLILGVFCDRKLRGLLEAFHCGGQDMEVALMVQRPWQRQGLGSALLAEAIRQGPSISASRYQLIFCPGNHAMRRIVEKADARLATALDEIQADIDLPATRN